MRNKKIEWSAEFERVDVHKRGKIWKMASGRYSDVEFDMWRLFENPDLYSKACNDLLKKADLQILFPCTWIMGLERDGIPLSLELARQSGARAGFASKTRFGAELKDFKLPNGAEVLLCSDVITKGGSLIKAAHAIEQAGGTIIEPILTFVNRSGSNMLCLYPRAHTSCRLHDFEIVSLVEVNEPGWTLNEWPPHLKDQMPVT